MALKVAAHPSPNEFFQAGGTLNPDFRSYVKRPADDELFEAAREGEFCYVLTTRQMGKSSMMVRAALRLQRQRIHTAIIDLTNIGADATADQWYLGLLTYLVEELELKGVVEVESWWQASGVLSPVQRFSNFLREVVLASVEGQVAIFIDEIDTTLRLDFSDDFFAAIRAMYNARATEPIYERLTFILIGVASPTDLMKDRQRTPFNIGRQIDLLPFKIEDKEKLRNLIGGLNTFYPGEGEFILNRVFYWTDGHPYLTQKLCFAIAEKRKAKVGPWTKEQIDSLVEREFLSERGRVDKNIQFANVTLSADERKDELLALYWRVYQGEGIADNKRSNIHSQLKLSGLVRAEDGYLRVNNRIYRHIFDLSWIKENTRSKWPPATAIITVGIIILVVLASVIVLSALFFRSREQSAALYLTQTANALALMGNETTLPTGIPILTDTPSPTAESIQMSTNAPVMTNTPSAVSTATPVPTDTPTMVPVPSDTPVPRAIVSTSTNIYPAPSIAFEPVGNVASGDEVEVLGLSTNGEWLFVRNTGSITGFAEMVNFALPVNIPLNQVPTPRMVVAIRNASILPEPESDPDRVEEIQRGFISPGEVVDVLGRLTDSTSWLYVRNEEGIEGFAAISLLDWPGTQEELETLAERQP